MGRAKGCEIALWCGGDDGSSAVGDARAEAVVQVVAVAGKSSQGTAVVGDEQHEDKANGGLPVVGGEERKEVQGHAAMAEQCSPG